MKATVAAIPADAAASGGPQAKSRASTADAETSDDPTISGAKRMPNDILLMKKYL